MDKTNERCQNCGHGDLEHDNFGDCCHHDKRTTTGLCNCEGLQIALPAA